MTLRTDSPEGKALLRRNGMRVTPLKRTPFGEKRRQQVRTEEGFYPTWEALLRLHGLDFWHCTVAQRSQPGWPDYAVFGIGWHAFVELKATSITTGRRGKVSAAQERWQDTIQLAGCEWISFLLPDDWNDVDDWLNGHTGKAIRGTWR